jgi:uncharacterized protein YhbP (UPF0306 family)
MVPDERILSFLRENMVASVCLLSGEHKPYCINCFYALQEEEMILVFKSGYGTTHDNFISENAPVSGTILPNQLDPIQIKGLQFNGKLLALHPTALLKYGALYAQKYPMSLAIPGYTWAAQLEEIKLTDNSLGFGTKLQWHSQK